MSEHDAPDGPGWEWALDTEARRYESELSAMRAKMRSGAEVLKTVRRLQQWRQHEVEAMTNVNDVYKSGGSNLKAEDLKGHEVKVTVDGHEVVNFEDGGIEKPKIVLKFRGKERGLVLNVTNARTIAEAHGDDVESWYGRDIILFPAKVEFSGRMVDAIRVRPVLPTAGIDDDIPF